MHSESFYCDTYRFRVKFETCDIYWMVQYRWHAISMVNITAVSILKWQLVRALGLISETFVPRWSCSAYLLRLFLE